MRRKRAFKRGRIVSLVIAGGVGYVLGGFATATVRTADLTAAQTVALRFPQELADAVDVGPAVSRTTDVKAKDNRPLAAARAAVMGGTQVALALLSPEPMAPAKTQALVSSADVDATAGAQASTQTSASSAQTAVSPAAAAPARMQLASADDASLPRVRTTAVPAPASANVAKPAAATAASSSASPVAAAAPPRRHLDQRPGFVLNDAQIASIRTRLHLTPDQESMWPAVEAALRNIAYARAREARKPGAPANAAQVASADPNSIEVQGLKSAAVPLIMSFNEDQKSEVRNLAHVMGLDQLAQQF
jgi:hypothetical protein